MIEASYLLGQPIKVRVSFDETSAVFHLKLNATHPCQRSRSVIRQFPMKRIVSARELIAAGRDRAAAAVAAACRLLALADRLL